MPFASPCASPSVAAAEYVPHRPHETVLYGIVREHLATFLATTESIYAAPLPRHVVDTFEHYSLAQGGGAVPSIELGTGP